MSDVAPAADAAPPADAPATPSPAPSVDHPGRSEADNALIDKLQNENVQYKDRFRPWEQAFDGIRDEDIQGFLGFVQDLRSGDPARVDKAVTWMRGNLDELSPAQQQAALAAAAEGEKKADDEFDPFDQDALGALMDRRLDERFAAQKAAEEAEKQRQDMLDQFDEHAKALAEKHGIPQLGVKGEVLFDQLFLRANQPEFAHIQDWKERLDAAADSIALALGEYAKGYMKSKSADADAPAADPAGKAPSGSTPPRTMKDARASASARLDALAKGPGN